MSGFAEVSASSIGHRSRGFRLQGLGVPVRNPCVFQRLQEMMIIILITVVLQIMKIMKLIRILIITMRPDKGLGLFFGV